MRDKAFLVLLAALVTAISGCTITHRFGPFSGKVVEAETGEPIEGAVVLIAFYTEGFSVGGPVYRFADAVEALTDAKGEFYFPPRRVTLYRSMSIWDNECRISIFKPGYGAYPKNSKTFSVPNLEQSRFIPENERITFHLPKLLTLEEKKENLYKVENPAGIPNDKMQNLRRLEDEERINVGID
jgi:hypothetical protein